MVDTVTVSQAIAEVWYEVTASSVVISQAIVEVWHDVTSPKIDVSQAIAEVWQEVQSPKHTISQMLAEVWWIEGVDVEPDQPCLITEPVHGTIASQYFIKLRNQAGVVVALFDNWYSMNVINPINGVGSYTLTFMDDGDPRLSMFELDGKLELWRKVGNTISWYAEFRGLHRKIERSIDSTGIKLLSSIGLSFNSMLSRTGILYKLGTINSDKNDAAETVMKEYVTENCGVQATIANGRESEGVLPNFTVEPTTGAGADWAGNRGFENLLDVLKEIAIKTAIDFNVVDDGSDAFKFSTFVNQMGSDRTYTGVNTSTGLNSSGNYPVTFAVSLGNVQSMSYIKDRIGESNVVAVLGKGEGSTRTVVVRSKPTKLDSPWNRHEIIRPGSNQDFTYQLEDLGDEVLEEAQYKEQFSFIPLQQTSSLYGKHYFLGDRVTAIYDEIIRIKRIVEIRLDIAKGKEVIEIEFADVP